MAGYFIANYTINDAEKYSQYAAALMLTLKDDNWKLLVGGDGHEILEGTPGANMVVVEFKSIEAAKSWYNSDAYQAINHLWLEATEGWAIIADKFEMPQS